MWHTPLRAALDGFVETALERVSGTVTVQLYKSVCQPVARTSPHTLYREDLATFGDDAVYDQKHAEGFIRLWGLPSEVHARVNGPSTGSVDEPADESRTLSRDRAAGSPAATGR